MKNEHLVFQTGLNLEVEPESSLPNYSSKFTSAIHRPISEWLWWRGACYQSQSSHLIFIDPLASWCGKETQLPKSEYLSSKAQAKNTEPVLSSVNMTIYEVSLPGHYWHFTGSNFVVGAILCVVVHLVASAASVAYPLGESSNIPIITIKNVSRHCPILRSWERTVGRGKVPPI